MSYIFISHVEEDADVALELALRLEQKGFSTWCYEVDSSAGVSYLDQVEKAIEQCKAIALVISRDSLGSHEVTTEVDFGHQTRKPFIPILRGIEHVEFQARQPRWRLVLGTATSIRIPGAGIDAIVPRVIDGLRKLGVARKKKPNAERLAALRNAIQELPPEPDERLPRRSGGREPPGPPEPQPTPLRRAYEAAKRWASRPLVGVVAVIGTAAVAVIIAVVAALLSGRGERPGPTAEFASTPTAPVSLAPAAPASSTATAGAPDERSPRQLWRFEMLGSAQSSPAVEDGAIYAGSGDGNVYAVDAVTGMERWRYKTGDAVYSSPAVEDGVVYIGSNDTYVYALDAASGEERWRFETYGPVQYSSPAVVQGVVYIASDARDVYALDAGAGEQLWRFDANEPIWSRPAVVGDTLYISGRVNDVYALDTATGEERWRFEVDYTGWGDTLSSPAVVDGTLYIGTANRVYALNASSGEERWRFQAGAIGDSNMLPPFISSPAVVDGVVYIGSRDGNVYALDAATGEELWCFEARSEIWSSPAVDEGVVYVDADERVYALDSVTGKERWHFRTGSSHSSPTVMDGIVYVGGSYAYNVTGYLYAIIAD